MKKLIIILTVLLLSSCGGKQSSRYPASDEPKMDMIVADSVSRPINLTVEDESFRSVNRDREGTFFYNIDTVFIIDVTSRAEAMIIKKVYDNIPDTIVELFHRTQNGTIKRELIKTGDVMDVNIMCLTPDAFIISKVENDQPVDEDIITQWIWGVTPKKIGNYNLLMKVSIKYNNGSRDRIVFDKLITVENKPKRYFDVDIKHSSSFKNLSTRSITCTIKETFNRDSADLIWGGKGKINIEFERSSNFPYKLEGDETINDDKGLFITKWSVTPNTKLKEVKTTISIIGDNDLVKIYESTIQVDKNFKQKFNNFIDVTLQRWYWLFTVLLIPIYNYIKKKVSPEKKLFTRKKRVVNHKPKTNH